MTRLTQEDEAALEELLEQDPVQNLFLLGFLDVASITGPHWYGVFRDDRLDAIVLALPRRLAVPYAPDSADAASLGRHLRDRHPPSMVVGPRAASDALWGAWAPDVVPDRYYDQRLYVCHEAPPGGPVDGFRRATLSEWRKVSENAVLMEKEDLGRDPVQEHGNRHAQAVLERIRDGRTWVIERDGEILFQINVGTVTPWGCQVGGTYVPIPHRGRGLAKEGMQELCRRLVPKHGMVTLHVNEQNTAAVRVYERSGFERHAPFRIITLGD